MTVIEPTDPRLKFVPEAEAGIPPAGFIEHFKDCYWVVHPEKGLVFWVTSGHLSPQCNRDESCVKALAERLYPWAEVKLIPSIFRSINPRDYT